MQFCINTYANVYLQQKQVKSAIARRKIHDVVAVDSE